MSCHVAVGINNIVKKVHIFGVDFVEKHLFGIASIVVIESTVFEFKALVPRKTFDLLLCLLLLLTVLLIVLRAGR